MADDTDIDDTGVDDEPFACPRCDRQVTSRFWGPCPSCRDELRATVHGTAHELEAVAYEPKMNVTPNAVATKD